MSSGYWVHFECGSRRAPRRAKRPDGAVPRLSSAAMFEPDRGYRAAATHEAALGPLSCCGGAARGAARRRRGLVAATAVAAGGGHGRSLDLGTMPRDIARAWVDAGVRSGLDAVRMVPLVRRRAPHPRRQLRDRSRTSPRQLLQKMVLGDETLATVRLIEGWTFRQFRAELARAGASGLAPATAGMSDAMVMRLGAPGQAREGRFPDTYAYSKGDRPGGAPARAPRDAASPCRGAWAGTRGPAAAAARRGADAGVDRREGNRRRRTGAASPACSRTGCAWACRCRPTRR